ncbi:MAG: mechanosensitive ion channel domain-containing protein [Bacteroidota bacterium]
MENRKVVTQLKVIERIVAFLLIIAAISFILMTFKTIREIGYSLLVSAGVIGIILGFAAQKSIANVVAGIQLAFAQPIRLNDVVIIEKEWGKIEEITLTYVVVKIWDERRLVVPLNQFIEKPFQNWTRNSSELLGTVFIYADYTLPLDELRQELKRLLNQHEYWDSRVINLQVTEARESTLQIRALMSARNAGEAFDLRCDIREGLITFIQKNYPESLPKQRIDWTGPDNRYISQF